MFPPHPFPQTPIDVILDEECERVGISTTSHRYFHEILIEYNEKEIALIAIPSNDIVTNMFLLSREDDNLVLKFIGSGFRHDFGGEGGAAFISILKTVKEIGGKINFVRDAIISYEDLCEKRDKEKIANIISERLDKIQWFELNADTDYLEKLVESYYRRMTNEELEATIREVIVVI